MSFKAFKMKQIIRFSISLNAHVRCVSRGNPCSRIRWQRLRSMIKRLQGWCRLHLFSKKPLVQMPREPFLQLGSVSWQVFWLAPLSFSRLPGLVDVVGKRIAWITTSGFFVRNDVAGTHSSGYCSGFSPDSLLSQSRKDSVSPRFGT